MGSQRRRDRRAVGCRPLSRLQLGEVGAGDAAATLGGGMYTGRPSFRPQPHRSCGAPKEDGVEEV